jgi:hypothetical protein
MYVPTFTKQIKNRVTDGWLALAVATEGNNDEEKKGQRRYDHRHYHG